MQDRYFVPERLMKIISLVEIRHSTFAVASTYWLLYSRRPVYKNMILIYENIIEIYFIIKFHNKKKLFKKMFFFIIKWIL